MTHYKPTEDLNLDACTKHVDPLEQVCLQLCSPRWLTTRPRFLNHMDA
ncbi:MAG: hypothetical protein IPL78_08120 [Chloroflexi bacterium]|nr:hypothetical protein [Chloroflexota bacterium]